MGAQQLQSQEFEGTFWERFEGSGLSPWAEALVINKNSNKKKEEYKFAGHGPGLERWRGERDIRKVRIFTFEIENYEYTSGLEFTVAELERDSTGQLLGRIAERGDKAAEHKPKTVAQLLLDGHIDECYDGVPFFSNAHVEGNSGVQSNLLTVSGNVDPLNPTGKEMANAMYKAIEQLWGLVDDEGDPRNLSARSFMFSVPLKLYRAATEAITLQFLPGDAGAQNFVSLQRRFNITVEPVLYLSPWASEFVITRTDGPLSPLIWQDEVPLVLEVQAEGSPLEVIQKKHGYYAYARNGAGYGWWYYAAKIQLT